ncbi:hypothetical protein [uncultured Kordia sp.]|uniref:hypothetical protein n=1 Tax=uncultured Kordia sp. TaxID=507699 RepID=UPI0026307524|nr:hypothetical protein [uncultured Kordia sp.]
MKYIATLLLIICCQNIRSQSVNIEQLFFDIVDLESSDENSKVGYLKKVHFGMLSFDLKNFEGHKSLTYSTYQRNTKRTDSITLSSTEKKYLITELRASKNFEWNLNRKNKLLVVENNESLAVHFLAKNKNSLLKIVSKPIFIRNNTIACVYSADLCCGHIYGHTSLSFYKRINGKWTEWIVICQGDF